MPLWVSAGVAGVAAVAGVAGEGPAAEGSMAAWSFWRKTESVPPLLHCARTKRRTLRTGLQKGMPAPISHETPKALYSLEFGNWHGRCIVSR
jgi:hypothetical protein